MGTLALALALLSTSVLASAPTPAETTDAPPIPTSKKSHETAAVKKDRAAALKEFVDACVGAFKKSQGDQITGMATELCQCTADEAGEEKIKAANLRAETAKIAENPKYQMQDKLLLQSFHICTADAMIDADHRTKEEEKAAAKAGGTK